MYRLFLDFKFVGADQDSPPAFNSQVHFEVKS